jgi:hypothetical protein
MARPEGRAGQLGRAIKTSPPQLHRCFRSRASHTFVNATLPRHAAFMVCQAQIGIPPRHVRPTARRSRLDVATLVFVGVVLVLVVIGAVLAIAG